MKLRGTKTITKIMRNLKLLHVRAHRHWCNILQETSEAAGDKKGTLHTDARRSQYWYKSAEGGYTV